LRNVAVTAPYFHDGSASKLEEVIEIYTGGGRVIEDGPKAGDGRASANKSPLITGFSLTTLQKTDLLAFLNALTDEEFLTHPAHSNPFTESETQSVP
ncbi:MAG: di-heme enzyme, partial [Myxococcota bacterium]